MSTASASDLQAKITHTEKNPQLWFLRKYIQNKKVFLTWIQGQHAKCAGHYKVLEQPMRSMDW